MSVKECVVCAWRATCNLKFRFESVETHCREFTRDVALPPQDEFEGASKDDDDKKPIKTAE